MRTHRQRAALSALGILIGTMAIILLVSIAKGVRRDIQSQVDTLGVNLLVVLPGKVSDGSMFAPNLAGISYLNDADVVRVMKVPGVKTAAPLMFVGGGIRYEKKESPTTFIIAAGAEWFNIHPIEMLQGSPYRANSENLPVCVIGELAKVNLFGGNTALHKKVLINQQAYEVVGVVRTPKKETDSSMFSMMGFENVVYVPYPYLRAHVPNGQLHRIMIRTDPEIEPKALVKAVSNALKERLSDQMFSVLTQEDLLKLVFKIMTILTALLTGLTSIALIVGGTGIMTVMLMSVNERSKEIGLRKTCGASHADIFQQFLYESMMLAALGGVGGLAVSVMGCNVIAAFTPVRPWLTFDTVLLSFGVSLAVGAFFGIIPALRASRKSPCDAMRSE